MNVLLINGHPRVNSFSDALANAFAEGSSDADVQLKRINVRDISFDLNVAKPVGQHQTTERDIAYARELILWAEHVVFVYPIWWGTAPALLKGFIDRVFTSEFAFLEIDGGTGYAPLLRGKTARLIITMDTPYFVYKWIYGDPGNKAMKRSLLRFCGFTMAPTLHFGPIKSANAETRDRWISKVRTTGANLNKSGLPLRTRLGITVGNWLKAIRLQFYPMTFLAYYLGSIATGLRPDQSIFWIGYLWIFFLEVATVLSNDYFDFETDKNNRYFSPFTGGSRVLVDKIISSKHVIVAILLCVGIALTSLIYVLFNSYGDRGEILVASSILFVLALGYTIPPLKLVYRGFGEITVCLTHSFAVIIAGYLFQGGRINNAYPLLLSIPLFLSIFPSIILAGVPDKEADEAAHKQTIAVKFGKRTALKLAITFAWLAAIAAFVVKSILGESDPYGNLVWAIIPHTLLITYFLIQFLRKPELPHRIDSLMIVTLTYIIWFVLIPLVT